MNSLYTWILFPVLPKVLGSNWQENGSPRPVRPLPSTSTADLGNLPLGATRTTSTPLHHHLTRPVRCQDQRWRWPHPPPRRTRQPRRDPPAPTRRSGDVRGFERRYRMGLIGRRLRANETEARRTRRAGTREESVGSSDGVRGSVCVSLLIRQVFLGPTRGSGSGG
jgi:hypothetical protein